MAAAATQQAMHTHSRSRQSCDVAQHGPGMYPTAKHLTQPHTRGVTLCHFWGVWHMCRGRCCRNPFACQPPHLLPPSSTLLCTALHRLCSTGTSTPPAECHQQAAASGKPPHSAANKACPSPPSRCIQQQSALPTTALPGAAVAWGAKTGAACCTNRAAAR